MRKKQSHHFLVYSTNVSAPFLFFFLQGIIWLWLRCRWQGVCPTLRSGLVLYILSRSTIMASMWLPNFWAVISLYAEFPDPVLHKDSKQTQLTHRCLQSQREKSLFKMVHKNNRERSQSKWIILCKCDKTSRLTAVFVWTGTRYWKSGCTWHHHCSLATFICYDMMAEFHNKYYRGLLGTDSIYVT